MMSVSIVGGCHSHIVPAVVVASACPVPVCVSSPNSATQGCMDHGDRKRPSSEERQQHGKKQEAGWARTGAGTVSHPSGTRSVRSWRFVRPAGVGVGIECLLRRAREVHRPRLAGLGRWRQGNLSKYCTRMGRRCGDIERGIHHHLMTSYHCTTVLGGLFQLGAFQENREAGCPASDATSKYVGAQGRGPNVCTSCGTRSSNTSSGEAKAANANCLSRPSKRG
ncbi:hypothetical protein BJV78DRAFT_532328 [Lactifluus subvellereus]|nr:hypothetical protein BJV78DRAFT_532328 [Lactifluus subvellereus]